MHTESIAPSLNCQQIRLPSHLQSSPPICQCSLSQIDPLPISCHPYISGINKSISLHKVQRGINLASVAWISLFIILLTVPLFPYLPSPFLLLSYARIWNQEERMMSIRNWSGKQKPFASTVCAVVCWSACVCVYAVTHLPFTFPSHSPIMLAWTSLWHTGIISRHALTGSTPSLVCCCCCW